MRDSFFLRAESYFNVTTEIERLEVGNSYGGRSQHAQSHGESFFALFMNRLRGSSLHLLDEPKAALSPSRQLAFLSRLHELVDGGSQFLIATRSPILMAYPQAKILLLADGLPVRVAYRGTEHYLPGSGDLPRGYRQHRSGRLFRSRYALYGHAAGYGHVEPT